MIWLSTSQAAHRGDSFRPDQLGPRSRLLGSRHLGSLAAHAAAVTNRLMIVALLLSAVALTGTNLCGRVEAAAWDHIPADSMAVVVVHDPQKLQQAVSEYAKLLGVPAPDFLELLQRQEPAVAEIDASLPAAVAFSMPGEYHPPMPLFILPVSDYTKFLQALGATEISEDSLTRIPADPNATRMEMVGIARDNHALLTLATPECEKWLSSLKTPKHFRSSELRPLTDWSARQDIVGILFKNGLSHFITEARTGLEQASQMMEARDDEEPKPTVAVLQAYLGLFTHIDNNIEMIAIGAHLNEQGCTLSFVGSYTSKSKWGNTMLFGEEYHKALHDSLGAIADAPYVVALGAATPPALHTMMSDLGLWGLDNMATQPGRGLSAQDREKLSLAIREAYRPLLGFSMVWEHGPLDAGIYANGYSHILVSNSESYLTSAEASMRQISDIYQKIGLGNLVPLSLEKIDIAGKPGLGSRISTSNAMQFGMQQNQLPPEGEAALAPIMQIMQRLLFGQEETVTQYMVALDEHHLVSGTQRKRLEQQIAEGDKQPRLVNNPRFKSTAEMLSPHSTLVAYLDLVGLFGTINQVVKEIQTLEIPLAIPQIPEFPAAPPIGLGLHFEPRYFELRIVQPRETFAALGQWIPAFHQEVVAPVMGEAVSAMQARGKITQSANNLRQVGLCILNDESTNRSFPTDIVDAQGKPLLSWRVRLLPYMDRADLYRQFRLDEPWDSEHNRQLLDKMPVIFAHPALPRDNKTVYLRPRMAGAILDPDAAAISTDVVSRGDGVTNTLMLIEAPAEHAVEWTRPGDWDIPVKGPIPGLANPKQPPPFDRFNVMFADGRVAKLPHTISADTLRALITYKGGEVVAEEALGR